MKKGRFDEKNGFEFHLEDEDQSCVILWHSWNITYDIYCIY